MKWLLKHFRYVKDLEAQIALLQLEARTPIHLTKLKAGEVIEDVKLGSWAEAIGPTLEIQVSVSDAVNWEAFNTKLNEQ